jgi:hypothetical protein
VKEALTFAAIAYLCAGCVSTASFNRLARELAKDPATVTVRVATPYGSLSFTRINAGTNTLPHRVAPDGTVTVGGRE